MTGTYGPEGKHLRRVIINYLIVFFSLSVPCFINKFFLIAQFDISRGRHSRRLACLLSHVLRA